jgi:type II secretory pathway component PulF
MPRFSYVASSSQGDSVRGIQDAVDKADLSKRLRDKNLFLVSFRIEESGASTAAGVRTQATPPASQSIAQRNTAAASAKKGPSFLDQLKDKLENKPQAPSSKGKVPLKELVILTRQISISINAGMSFVEALQSLAANAKNPKMSWVLRQVLDDILSGKRFSDALAAHPDVFKPVYVSMAAAGEAGGFMPEALNRTAEFLEKEIELRAKIKSAMAYPVVIASVATIVIIGMMTFIVPTFIKIFQDMNAPLPLPTKILVAASKFTRSGGFLLPVVFVALFFYAQRLRNSNESFRVWWDEWILAVPLFGKIISLEIITRFIRTLASLVSNGVMALQAISVSRQVVENRSIEKVVDEIFSSVQQGNGISPVLYRSKHFPVLVANMVSTGEKTGAIPEVLNKMADYYDAEVSSAIRDLLTLMEPMLIVVMAVIVGFVIAGLMLPMFQMSSLAGG